LGVGSLAFSERKGGGDSEKRILRELAGSGPL
jgi:hypothetical protein